MDHKSLPDVKNRTGLNFKKLFSCHEFEAFIHSLSPYIGQYIVWNFKATSPE